MSAKQALPSRSDAQGAAVTRPAPALAGYPPRRRRQPPPGRTHPGREAPADRHAHALARPDERGIMLVECLVYISVFFVVVGLAFAAFYRALDFARQLRRNAGDITLALDVGERWRTDVRSATAPLQLAEEGPTLVLRVPRGSSETTYLVTEGSLYRRATQDAPPIRLMSNLKSLRFHRDQRERIVSWRCEMELKSRLKSARLPPLFTFLAAASPDWRP